jgi:hypothetical protein
MIFSHQDTINTFPKYLWLRSFWRSLNIFGLFPIIWERLFFLSVLIIFPFLIKGFQNKILILIWILFPFLVLFQYKGAISEYYYGMVTSLIPLFLSYILFKITNSNIILASIISILLLSFTYNIATFHASPITLNDKKAIVDYLINQKQDQPFNLSYETGVGLDFGFNYLFSYLGHLPQNTNNAHLYTLFTNNTLPKNSNVVFKQNIYSLVRR